MDIRGTESHESKKDKPTEVMNAEFRLFKPERTISGARRNTKESEFELQTEIPGNEEIQVRITTTDLTDNKLEDVITPFNPEQGRHFNRDDYDYEKRIANTQTEKDKNKTIITPEMNLHTVDIECEVNNLTRNESDTNWVIPTESPLNSLRLILAFPTGILLESKPHAIAKIKPTITFSSFYPTEGPSLPIKGSNGFEPVGKTFITDGGHIGIPLDQESLNGITAFFIQMKPKPDNTN